MEKKNRKKGKGWEIEDTKKKKKQKEKETEGKMSAIHWKIDTIMLSLPSFETFPYISFEIKIRKNYFVMECEIMHM